MLHVSHHEVARSIVVRAGLPGSFDAVVDGVLARLREELRVPDPPPEGDDPAVLEEFRRARARLLAFREEYVALHAKLLERHLGADLLDALAAALAPDVFDRFFGVLPALASEAARENRALADAMRQAVLFEAPR